MIPKRASENERGFGLDNQFVGRAHAETLAQHQNV
jgi:hypothetical protein